MAKRIKLSELDLSLERLEAGTDDRELYRQRVLRESLRTEELSDYLDLRRMYGKWILIATLSWITAIIVIVFLQGFKIEGFSLSDSVLLTLLGTTIANVVGLFILVVKYLFPENKSKDKTV